MSTKSEWQEHYIQAVRILTEAEFSSEPWFQLLDYVARVIGASAGTIAVRARGSLELVDPVAATWPDEALAEYFDPQNPRERDPVIIELTGNMFQVPDNVAFSVRELLDPRAYKRSGFFHDFAGKYDLPDLTGTSFQLDDAHCGALFFHRPERMLEFSEEQRRFLESISPLVRFALRYRAQAGDLAAARGALDHLTIALMLLDERGRITHINPAARRLIRGSASLAVACDRVISADPYVTAQIERLCRHAGQSPPRAGEFFIHEGGARDGNPFIHMIVLPISERRSLSLWGRRVPAAMILRHSHQELESTLDAIAILRDGYRCTPAEARVGALFAAELERKDIAARLAISESTVKAHLSKVHRKTHTVNKVELVALFREHLLPLSLPSLSPQKSS
jgi:DNA-binding CsgD family transcriptional regulator